MSHSLTQVVDELRGVALRRDAASDGQLLERFLRQRDGVAFAALVRRHGPMVLGVCRRLLGHAQDAEDAFQATFLVLARKAAAVVPREQVGNWLHGVARRTALEARKRNTRRLARENAMRDTAPPAPAADDAWLDLQPLLDAALGELPDKYRTAIVLCDLEGRPRKEAARHLGVPEGTISSRLAAGRKLLAEGLRRRGVELTAGLLGALVAERGLAAVPAALAAATARAAVATVLGGATTAAVSAEVAALSEGVLKMLLLTKLKCATLVLLAALAAALVAPPAAVPVRAEKPPAADAPAAAPAPAAAQAKVWQERATLKGHQAEVSALAFGADLLVTGDRDGLVKVWDPNAGKLSYTLFEKKPLGAVERLAVRDTNDYVGVGGLHNGTVTLSVTKLDKDKPSGGGVGGMPGVRPLALLGDFQTWALDRKNTLVLMEFGFLGKPPANPQVQFQGHTGPIHAVAFSANEKTLATASADKTVRVWDRGTMKTLFSVAHDHEALSVALTPDGKILASSDKGGAIKLSDGMTGKERVKLAGHQGAVRALAIDPEGKLLASAGDDGNVQLWDVATGQRVATLTGHKGAVLCVAFSRDGRVLASGGQDQTVKLWAVGK